MMNKSGLTETNPPLDYPKELLSLNEKLSLKTIDFYIMKILQDNVLEIKC